MRCLQPASLNFLKNGRTSFAGAFLLNRLTLQAADCLEMMRRLMRPTGAAPCRRLKTPGVRRPLEARDVTMVRDVMTQTCPSAGNCSRRTGCQRRVRGSDPRRGRKDWHAGCARQPHHASAGAMCGPDEERKDPFLQTAAACRQRPRDCWLTSMMLAWKSFYLFLLQLMETKFLSVDQNQNAIEALYVLALTCETMSSSERPRNQ